MKFKKFLILFIATFFFSFINVDAFSTSLGAKNEVYLNENITVNINLSNLGSTGLATGQYYLNYDSNKVQYVGFNVGQGKPNADYSVSDDGNKVILLYIDNTATDNPLKNGIFASVTFKAIAIGQVNFSVSGSGFSTVDNGIVDLSTNGSSKSINIINNTTTTTTTTTKKKVTTTTTTTTTTKKENINNEDSTTTTTTTTIPTSKKEIINNETNTTTTKENTTEKISNNLNLKFLKIEGIEFNFDKDILEYEINVPFEMEKIEFIYELEDSKSNIEISDTNLNIGENEITIKINAEDKTNKIYKFKVHKSPKYTEIEFNKIKLIELLNAGTQFIEMNAEITNDNIILEKEFIDLIKEKNAEIKINISNKKEVIYYLIINSKNIKYISDYLDLNIIDETFKLKQISNDSYLILNIKNNKTINKNIDIYFNAKHFKIDKLYLYKFNEKMKLVKDSEYKITSDYLKLNLEENNIYMLSNSVVNSNNNNLTIILIVVLLSVILIIISLFIMKKQKIWWFK